MKIEKVRSGNNDISRIPEKDTSLWNDYGKNDYDALKKLIPYQKMMGKICRHISNKNAHLLDAGCGTGNFIEALLKSKKWKKKTIIGVDFAKEMLAISKQKFADKKGRVYIFHGDLNEPLSINMKFDEIISINCLYSLKNPLLTLRFLSWYTTKGGRIIIVTPKKGYENGLILKEHCGDDGPSEPWLDGHSSPQKEKDLIYRAVSSQELRQKLMGLAYQNRKINQNQTFHFLTEKEIRNLVQKSGFKIEKIESIYANQCIMVIARKTK